MKLTAKQALVLTVVLAILGEGIAVRFGVQTDLARAIGMAPALVLAWVVFVKQAQPMMTFRHPTPYQWRVWLPALLLLQVALSSAFILSVFALFPDVRAMVQAAKPASSATVALAGAFVASVVFAPLFEEILFRGLLQPAPESYKGRLFAVIVTSVLFALLHFRLYMTLDLFFASCILCLVAQQTRSLVPGIALHALFNLYALTTQAATAEAWRPLIGYATGSTAWLWGTVTLSLFSLAVWFALKASTAFPGTMRVQA